MIAVLLNGGKTEAAYAQFPENSPPKCLFHIDGEVILERQIRLLKEAGVSKIRVITGYKAEEIEKFVKEKDFKDVELIYNLDWETDALGTVKLGIKGVNDDLYIVCGDIYFYPETLTAIFGSKSDFVMNWVDKSPGDNLSMWKVSKRKLYLLSRLDTFQERKWRILGKLGEGPDIVSTLRNLFLKYQCERLEVPFLEFDFFYDCDEGKAQGCRKLGLSNTTLQEKQAEITFVMRDEHSHFVDYDGAFDAVEKNIHFKPKSRILEVGCGLSPYGLKLAKEGHSVVGIDIAPNCCFEKGKEVPNFESVIGDIEEMPKRFYEEFDYVFCGMVLHHFPIIEKVVVEMSKCLKPGGELIIVEPNGGNDHVVMGCLLNRLYGASTLNEKTHSPFLYAYCVRMMGYYPVKLFFTPLECLLIAGKGEFVEKYINSVKGF